MLNIYKFLYNIIFIQNMKISLIKNIKDFL